MTIAKEFRDQSLEELELLLSDSKADFFKMKNRAKLEKPDKPHIFGLKKKEIAVLKTVIREKQGRRT